MRMYGAEAEQIRSTEQGRTAAIQGKSRYVFPFLMYLRGEKLVMVL
jgi:hypothetical protein